MLAGALLAAYGQVLHFDFVTYDDPDYVTANPQVQAGLTWPGVAWAFRTSFAGNWFPLTRAFAEKREPNFLQGWPRI